MAGAPRNAPNANVFAFAGAELAVLKEMAQPEPQDEPAARVHGVDCRLDSDLAL